MKDSPAEYASRTLTAAFSLSDALYCFRDPARSIAWADNKTDKAEIPTVDSPDDSSAILKKLGRHIWKEQRSPYPRRCGISGFAHLICIGRPDAGPLEIYYNVKSCILIRQILKWCARDLRSRPDKQ